MEAVRMSGEQGSGAGPAAAWTRLLLGFAQGMVLLALHEAWVAHQWPATTPWLFSASVSVAFFIPTTLLAGIGRLRFATLLLWTLVAGAVVAGLAAHSVLREVRPGTEFNGSFGLWSGLAAGLFIAFHLVAAADAD